jgi:hypothetical protein
LVRQFKGSRKSYDVSKHECIFLPKPDQALRPPTQGRILLTQGCCPRKAGNNVGVARLKEIIANDSQLIAGGFQHPRNMLIVAMHPKNFSLGDIVQPMPE